MKNAINIIEDFYGGKVAKRSGVKLINHIYEGVEILKKINADRITIDAYCLHPIIQNDQDFLDFLEFDNNYCEIDPRAWVLACEYRNVANSFLSDKIIKNSDGEFLNQSSSLKFCERIKKMLIADKVQNKKDFMIYHLGKHDRSDELAFYFNAWLEILEISNSEYERLVTSL